MITALILMVMMAAFNGAIIVGILILLINHFAERRGQSMVGRCAHCDFDLRGCPIGSMPCPACGRPLSVRWTVERTSYQRFVVVMAWSMIGLGLAMDLVIPLLLFFALRT